MKHPAVFLDRDGIINKHRNDYVKNLNEFEILNDVPYYLKKLRDLGFKLIIITNQSAINRGLTTLEQVKQMHEFLEEELKRDDCYIDGIYLCPHRPDENCDCRKPKTKLFLEAAKKHNIDLIGSWVIGDSETDIEAGTRIGCRTIKIDTNGSLEEAVEIIARSLTENQC